VCYKEGYCYAFNTGTCPHSGDHTLPSSGERVRHVCTSCKGPHPNFKDGFNASCASSLWPVRTKTSKERRATRADSAGH
jgi:hypothetical protein